MKSIVQGRPKEAREGHGENQGSSKTRQDLPCSSMQLSYYY